MSSLDIKKKIRESKSDYDQVRDDQINTNRLKAEVTEFSWDERSGAVDRGSSKTFTVVKEQGATVYDPDPQMKVSRRSDVLGTVTLHKGMVIGLNEAVKLPTQSGSDLAKYCGDHIKIYLGKQITELKEEHMIVSVALQVKGNGFSATTEAKKFEYKGLFATHGITMRNTAFVYRPVGEIEQRERVHKEIGKLCKGDFQCVVNIHGKVMIDLNGKIRTIDFNEKSHNVRGSIAFECPLEQEYVVN